ncbi:MAG: CBS domain-containing protein [Chloroflexi bacterium]|nr:CBS domain-containing protein [Chloroflexota bacterium]
MVMVTALVQCAVVDDRGRRATLSDLDVDLFDGEYPPVNGLVFHHRGRHSLLPWSSVKQLGDLVRVDDLSHATPYSPGRLARRVLVVRDILDALVLDLARERAVRINDVWLRLDGWQQGGYDGGRCVVAAADISARAIIRRIMPARFRHGRLGRHRPDGLVDWRDVELLLGEPNRTIEGRTVDGQLLTPRVARLTPAQIADLAEALPYLHATELLNILPVELAADVFELLWPERQVQVIGELSEMRALRLLADIAPDHATDVLARLPLHNARRFLERLPRSRAALVEDLLQYPHDTAGGIMTNEVVVVPVGLTVAQTIGAIRPQIARPDLVYYVYVVRDLASRRLEGVVTLRDLLLAEPAQPVREVMQPHLVSARAFEPARAVAYRLADNQLNALPVESEDGRLLGIVTIDNAVSQIAPETLRKDIPRVFT